MASLEPGEVERWRASKPWRPMAVAAIALGALAFSLAQWPLVYRAGLGDFENASAGLTLIIAGGFPWFLQWASLAMLFTVLVRHQGYLDRRTTIAVVVLPLAVGSCWWIGVAITHWGDDPLDFLLNTTMRSISRGFGAETLAQGALFEILGPLTCPLMLRGPYVLAGWTFLWTALSTTLVMLLLAWTARKLKRMKDLRLSGPRRCALVGAVVLIYDLPVFIRAVIRVVISFQAT